MKKWAFWMTMWLVSILNGALFFGASLSAMNRGLDGVENQAAFLFVPLLWAMAALVLIAISLYTLVRGMKIKRERVIGLFDIFQTTGLSKKAKAHRAAFLIMTGFLMLFGYSLFAKEAVWAVSYALTGGALLLFLYAWEKASVQPDQTVS